MVTILHKITLRLDSIERVKAFVELVSRYPFDTDLVSGRYTVNAKSIMGIFSLDLSKPVTLVIHSEDCAEVFEQLRGYQP